MALLEISHLTRSFGGLKAVDELSFSVEEGMIYAIIGPNGAGKTTIFNCISGIYTPDRGDILFREEDLTRCKPHDLARRGIARTFQNLELFPRMTTLENLMLGRHLKMRTGVWRGATFFRRRSPAAREEIAHREAVERIIDFLELQAVRDRFAGELPYGTQKLIELGRALATEPQLLLLDEPFAGMNREERIDLFFWLKDIRDGLGATILMIEHDMQMVMDISDRVLALDFGKKLAEGPGAEVAAHPEVIAAYLGETKEHASPARD